MKDSFHLNFECNDLLEESEEIWLSLQHSYDIKMGYRIQRSDIIKFGTVMLFVKEIGYDSYNTNDALLDLSYLDLVKSQEYVNKNNSHSNTLLMLNTSTSIIGSKPSCRICLDDKNSINNPLVTPCNCKGTMEYIHLFCLRKMIKVEIIKRSHGVIFYIFSLLKCDLCNTQYLNEVTVGNNVYSLCKYEKPKGNYIVFLRSLKKKEIFIVVHLEEGKSVAIGKTPLVDIPFPDFSMSYVHAMISYSKGQYYLVDLKSKYGTYIKIPKQINVLPFHKITLQINHYFFTFSMKKTLIAYLYCYYPKNLIFKSYNDYFTFLSKRKEHRESKYPKKSLHKKQIIKTILNTGTSDLLFKPRNKFKTLINQSKNSSIPSIFSNIINA